eukprot:CAMPEP_0168792060 /NCGR_PEP_ID=MMETSP0725-20121227/14318_1 /TAXON_ID=265536 /ORGANISM="Amphiprora sp., Strain CCMP467" /LENGTH=192 /DNA_ID=CAMNT_0008842679 /DNA_START=82 /DNA_END=660 /DNA_ORIENTATION=-
MVRELNYTTISHVLDSWEEVRRLKSFEETVGTILFQTLFKKSPQAKVLFGFPIDIDTDSQELLLLGRLFKKSPQAKVLFGFPIDIDTDSQELLTSKRFLMHAAYLVQMLDTALNMVGPDIELLTEIMLELGSKHVRYGVKPEMFPIMGEAIIVAMSSALKERFTDDVEEAWKETFHELSTDMIRGMAEARKP